MGEGKAIGIVISHSLFSTKRLIFLSGLIKESIGSSLEKEDEWKKCLDALTKDNIVVIISNKPDKRTSFYKFISKISKLETFKPMNEQDAYSFVKEMWRSYKYESNLLNYFILSVGLDSWILSSESKKLLSYVSDDKIITKEDIEDISFFTEESSVFLLLDAVYTKSLNRILKYTKVFANNSTGASQFFYVFSSQVSKMILVHEHYANNIPLSVNMHPFVKNKMKQVCTKYTMEDLNKLHSWCLEMEYSIKTSMIKLDNPTLLFLSLEKLMIKMIKV